MTELDGRIAEATDGALGWIADNLDEFRVESPDALAERGQRLAELAVTAYCCSRFLPSDPRAQPVVELLEETRRAGWFRDLVVRLRGETPLFAMLHGCLRRLGREDEGFTRSLDRVARAGFTRWMERPPNRILDLRMSLEWCGVDPLLPPAEDLLAQSILAEAPPSLLLDETSAYQMTHVVMFATEFGTRHEPVAGLPRPETMAAALGRLVAIWSRRANWDLVAELLFCWCCLRLRPDRLYEMGWRALLGALGRDGSVPGSARNAASDAFESRYHTTLVLVLAGSLHAHLLTAAGRADSLSQRDRAARAHVVRHAPDVQSAVQRSADWLATQVHENAARLQPEDLCELLVGCWMCSSLTTALGGPDQRDFRDAAKLVLEALGRTEEERAQRVTRSYVSCLAAAAVARSEGIRLPFLESVVGHAAHALSVAGTHDPALFEPAFLVGLLREGTRQVQVPYAAVLDSIRGSVEGAGHGLETVAHSVTAWTGGRDGEAVRDPDVRSFLLAQAYASLSTYALPLGCHLLRCAAYSGVPADELREALDFLVLHQRPEGSFGYLAISDALGDNADARRRRHLPITLACLRALGEAALPEWRFLTVLEAAAGSVGSGRTKASSLAGGGERGAG